MPDIALPADLHFEDDHGLNLARLTDATDPTVVTPGTVLIAGSPKAWAWAEVVEIDDEGWGHLRQHGTGPATLATVTAEQHRDELTAWFRAHPGFGPDNWVDAFRDAEGELQETDEFFDAAALFARGGF